ncbi:uncharacterized protein LOC114536550 [Dendronephthya gigantea]|uniref:uncharacterized protein LOC114536550 n=1 Tax=Dendronephthya gigantea TaxID=151771 RepID=UPI00106D7B23|nr:uncharacterized protein LOC114536550 [Dendronephthya gigantea]
MARSSGQHKCGLIFCGITMLILGSGITITGFLNDFLDPYDELSKPTRIYFTHTQYWLGIPLFLLGVFVTTTSCSKISCLKVFGLMAASMALILAMFAVVLEGPQWRRTLKDTAVINDLKCSTEDKRCVCRQDDKDSSIVLGLAIPSISCDEIKFRAVIYSVMVGFSVLAIPFCLFCAFIYFRILGWMLHISYDNPIDDYYAKAVNSHFINGHHGRGVGRANEVALGTYPH